MSDDLQDTLENAAIFGAIQRGNNQRAQQMRPQGPPCPYCGGPIPRIGVELCMHCNQKLAWVDSTPCKPGEESKVRALKTAAKKRHNQEERSKQTACIVITALGLVIGIAGLLGGGLGILDNSKDTPPWAFIACGLGVLCTGLGGLGVLLGALTIDD